MISTLVTSAILPFILMLIHGYTTFFVYFMYSFIGCLLVGIPCSLITDLIVLKTKGRTTMPGGLIGLTLHLTCAGIIVYLYSLTEPIGFVFQYANVLVFSVFIAATGFWLVDTIFKKILFSKYKKSFKP